MSETPIPTDPYQPQDRELDRWTRVYEGPEFYYGDEPGPVARRALRYHRPWFHPGHSTALDAGCGEGQDLSFLAERGYQATGVEFTTPGAEKSRQLLAERGQEAEVIQADLRSFLAADGPAYDLLLAVNCLQFLGADASAALDRAMARVASGGVFGLSLFAREEGRAEVSGTIWFTTLEEILERFSGWQAMEAAKLWQWDTRSNRPQPFLTLIARKSPPATVVPLPRPLG